MIVLGIRSFGIFLGHGGEPMSGIRAVTKEAPKRPHLLLFCHVIIQWEVCDLEEGPHLNHVGTLIFGFPAPELWEVNFCCIFIIEPLILSCFVVAAWIDLQHSWRVVSLGLEFLVSNSFFFFKAFKKYSATFSSQGCILSPCFFNLYAEYIMRNAGLDEVQAGIKIAGRNVNNLRYADNTTLMAESKE